MIPEQIVAVTTATVLTFTQLFNTVPSQVVATQEISLENRYPVKSVSDIFQDNILLNLAYMRGLVASKSDLNWDEVTKPFHYEFKLEPNKTFAYHDDVLPEYEDKLVKTTQAHFNAAEGFKNSGYLFGDGVCHLASLIYWVAKDAGLDAKAPINHDFRAIPEVDKQYGVSIYSNNKQQNLYVTNNTDKTIVFYFDYVGGKLRVSIIKEG